MRTKASLRDDRSVNEPFWRCSVGQRLRRYRSSGQLAARRYEPRPVLGSIVGGQLDTNPESASAQSRTHGPTHELLTVASQSVTHDAKGNMTLTPAVLRPGSDPLKIKWDFEIKLIATDTETPVSPSDPVGTLVPF